MTVALLPSAASRAVDYVRARIDGVSLLSVYLLLLVAIPSRFVIGPLGGAGTPAQVLGVAGLIWWIFSRLQQTQSTLQPRRQPVRAAAGLLASAIVISYVVACLRPTNSEEMSLATLAFVTLGSWLGSLLVAHDGVLNSTRLATLVRRLALAGAMLASFGLVQFVTHEAWIDRISIPGLTANSVGYGTQSRGSFTRPLGTAIHPIEFGVVLSMLLPLALAFAATATTGRRGKHSPLWAWLAPLSITVAVALSNSRSTLVCAAVGILVVILRLAPRARAIAASGAALVGVAVFVTVPGMLGTVLGMFTGIGSDSSAQSRVGSYGVALSYISHSPMFGRGFATFQPRYRIFDNQYLLSTVEIGLVGTGMILVLFITSIVVAHRVAASATDVSDGLLVQGLAGGVAAGAVSLALFDALSFPMVPGVLFLLVGLTGAARRIVANPGPRTYQIVDSLWK